MKTTRIAIAFGMSLLFSQTGWTHDGWIEVTTAIVEKGQPVIIALLQGNHSNEHKSYRLAGKWTLEAAKVTILSPSEKPSI